MFKRKYIDSFMVDFPAIVMLVNSGVENVAHPLLSKTLDWWHNDRWDLAKAPGNVNKKDFIQGTYLLI